MKVLLVTSDVTYTPRNYADVFETLLEQAGEHIAGLVVLKGFSWNLIKRTTGLYSIGCTRLAGTLTRNMLGLLLSSRRPRPRPCPCLGVRVRVRLHGSQGGGSVW